MQRQKSFNKQHKFHLPCINQFHNTQRANKMHFSIYDIHKHCSAFCWLVACYSPQLFKNHSDIYRYIVLNFFWSREDVVDIPTRLRTGGIWVRIPVRERNISLLESAQSGSGAHPASYSIYIGILALGYSGRGVMLISQPSLLPRLRMNVS